MVTTAHTVDLEETTLAAVRALLEDVFEGEFDAYDWAHCLGGVHALAYEGDELVGHAAVVGRQLIHQGRTLRTGYVEGVGVRADRRGRGHGWALMEAIEQHIRATCELGALGATDAAAGLYAARGWRRWEGPTSALTPEGTRPTDEDSIHVLPVTAALDLTGELTADWRAGDVW
jgi:aminoglycoside 2'-N-acetyltransferase I